MKKEYRIRKSREFEDIIHTGQCLTRKPFVMYYRTAVSEHDRVGISVGKRMGNAVERNRIKRQMRMMIKEISDFQSGFDYIIIARTGYHEGSYEANKKDLSALYQSVYNSKRRTK